MGVNKKNRVGEKYLTKEGYSIEIIEYKGNNFCTIKFDNGLELDNIKFHHIKDGNIKNPNHKSIFNVGYYGYGKYKSWNNNKTRNHDSYIAWLNMFRRIYSKNSNIKFPSYIGCSVHEYWHNYQNFAKWYEENYIEKFHLDKDLLIKGNKIYGPYTCCFLPIELNILFRKIKKKDVNKITGVKSQDGMYLANLDINNKRRYLGSFKCKNDAFLAYKKEKETLISVLAEKYKGIISDAAYNALLKYIVEKTD